MPKMAPAMAIAAFLTHLLPAAAVCLPFEAHCCHINPKIDPNYQQFKADPSSRVPGWEVVDLDLPPSERWRHLVTPMASQIRTMITHFKALLGGLSKDIFKLLEDSSKMKVISERVLKEMGEYGLEIRSIANATGILVEDLFAYNIAYELEGGCTSIVAQDDHGRLIHGRYDNSDWAALRAFLEGKCSGNFLSLLLRDVMVGNHSFSEALATMRSAKLLGPAYVILGGTGRGEGAVLERGATAVVNETLLSDVAKQGINSVVQTNWDYNKDPWYDNRRSPAEHCLQERYNRNITFEGMFSVLAAHPNRNRLTTHTALMSAETGDCEAYIQFCNDTLCAPWMEQLTV